MIRRTKPSPILGRPAIGPDLDTLATALYVPTDDLLINHPEWAPERPVVGIVPKLSDAELVHPGGDTGSVGIHILSPFPTLRAYPPSTLA